MIELYNNGELKHAIIRGRPDADDLPLLRHVNSLAVEPEQDDFQLQSPLTISELHILYVKKCQQPLAELLDSDTLTHLRSLIVADAAGCIEDLSTLVDLPRLEKLAMCRLSLEEKHLSWICRQKGLIVLSITDANFTDNELMKLSCRNSLKRLDLFRSTITFRDERLRGVVFPLVRSLDISGTEVSGREIDIIHSMFPRLERLLALDTALTEADVGRIEKWEGLRVLSTGWPKFDFDLTEDDFWET